MDPKPVRAYRIAGFRLDLSRRSLTGPDGAAVALSGRGYDVLVYLVENRHRVVGKDELMKAVWPRVVVEENSLTQAISHARRALGDSRETPRFVATVAGRGYQFVGDVLPLDEAIAPDAGALASISQSPNGAWIAAATAPANVHPAEPSDLPARSTRRAWLAGVATLGAVAAGYALTRGRSRVPGIGSIAVLPFKPLAGGERDLAVEVGVAELLINRLSVLPGIVVTPLSTVLPRAASGADPVAIGRELDVDAIVDGHVQIRDGKVRITSRLLATADGRALWSGQFTEAFDDFFAVQESLASRIASAVSAVAPGNAGREWAGYGTRDSEAWQIYASGRLHLDRRDADGLRRARDLFDAAYRRDPQFALALAAAADARVLLAAFGVEPTATTLAEARRLAVQSLAADEDVPEAHLALGHVLTQFDRDFAGARDRYRRALELRPDHAWAHALLSLNLIQSSRVQDALRHIRQAQSLEPATLAFSALAGWFQHFARRTDESLRMLRQLVETVPHAALPRQFLAQVLLANRDGAAVIRLLQGRNVPTPGYFSTLGRAYVLAGRIDDARTEIARIEGLERQGFGVAYDLALLHLESGTRDAALGALERALTDHSQNLGYLNVEPALDSLRGEPRFRAVARQIEFG